MNRRSSIRSCRLQGQPVLVSDGSRHTAEKHGVERVRRMSTETGSGSPVHPAAAFASDRSLRVQRRSRAARCTMLTELPASSRGMGRAEWQCADGLQSSWELSSMNGSNWISLWEACRQVGGYPELLWNLAHRHGIEIHLVGSRRYISRDELEALGCHVSQWLNRPRLVRPPSVAMKEHMRVRRRRATHWAG
jgi:hypothetical protein